MTTLSHSEQGSINTPIALTIAGSDSGGGAGIQADLKAFSALNTYGCSVITALTAQNTLGVQGILDVDPAFIEKQLDSVFSDLDIKAVKIGMLSQPEVIRTVVRAIDKYDVKRLIVDPVMVATSGDVLLQKAAIETLKDELFPKACLITPNLHEAAVLLDTDVPESIDQMLDLVVPLLQFGSKGVLLKGGHLVGDKAVDFYHDGESLHRLESPWIKTKNTHGTGCTLSSAITALLACGFTISEAIPEAKKYITGAITHSNKLNIGQGNGPVHHFFRHW